MIADWLMPNILWISLFFLLVSAITKRSVLAGLGWGLFGAFWLGQPGHYLAIEDYFNATFLVSLAIIWPSRTILMPL